jgi:lantibiotic modifying enzyme
MSSTDEVVDTIVRAAVGRDDAARPPSAERSTAASDQNSQSVLDDRIFESTDWASELRTMLVVVNDLKFSSGGSSPLQKMCDVGSQYGLKTLDDTISSELLRFLSRRALRRLKTDLRQTLARASRACVDLELKSFRCAAEAVCYQKQLFSQQTIHQKFLGQSPRDRLISLFLKFPVLAKLWCLLIIQWRSHVGELLRRFRADERALSRTFFANRPPTRILDIRPGLSDAHNKGRAVTLLRSDVGSIVYKPRCGWGEQAWFDFVQHLNRSRVPLQLRAAKVICRDGYCWMEEIKFAPCESYAAARRFYRRIGETMAILSLLRTVDCHRDNFIASGDYPVLIDAETLWHVPPDKRPAPLLRALKQSGFIPSSHRHSSWHTQTTLFATTARGRHNAQIGSKRLNPAHYKLDIIKGFNSAWRCSVGNAHLRNQFNRRLRRLYGMQLRWIYCSTRKYDAVARASVQPMALRSEAQRNLLIGRLCARTAVHSAVVAKEVEALKRLDIPYFVRVVKGQLKLRERTTANDALRCVRCILRL